MKHKFICFTGIDGSGKTTQAKALVESLNKENIKCKYVYNRYVPMLFRPFMFVANKIFLRKKDMFKDYKSYSNTKKGIFKNKLLSNLYSCILLGDYFFQILFKIKIPLLFTSIVCDRYIYDTVITDLSVDLNYSQNDIKNLMNILFKIFPKPDITFLIDVDEKVAFGRKDDVPALEYLTERRMMYLWIGKECEMNILDGSKDVEELKKIIRNIINKVFNI